MSHLFEAVERAAAKEKRAAFLSDPSILEAALPRFRAILVRFDELMRANKVDEACELEEQANALAVELWGEECGCMDAMDALADATAASSGSVPMWGQKGEFVASLSIYKIRFTYDGIFGIGGPFSFAIHAVEFERPFFSETGYRSFCGYMLASVPEGCTVDAALVNAVRQYANNELKGKYPFVRPEHRPEAEGERLYLFDLGERDKPVGDLAGYRTNSAAMATCRALRAKSGKGANATVVCRGPYTREAFESIIANHGWRIVNVELERFTHTKADPLPAFCEGCGETLERCDCRVCEECGESLEDCECDETGGLEAEPVEDVKPVAAPATKPEQLSLF